VSDNRQALLSLYDLLPFEHHPLWTAVLSGSLSLAQVLAAEKQHWIRTRAGQRLRRQALELAERVSPGIFELLLETYVEECTRDETGPSHLELIERLLVTSGVTRDDLENAQPTPGNAAAMALYADIGRRGAGCHMLGAGAVEFYYCQLSPRIYEAYLEHYGMSAAQAETYRIHGPMDKEHAERAFAALPEAISLHGWDAVNRAVRDAFVATSLHYDGMLQAATGVLKYWDGSFE
jgi:pyrroloquinoline quinone (PQQ) biosynthesis protein C